MQLKGLQLEFVVIGALSMFWICEIGEILNRYQLFPDISISQDVLTIILIPTLYVIGVQIDCVIKLFLSKSQNKIKNSCFKKASITCAKPYDRLIEILSKCPEAIGFLDVRKTRDRIIRGILFNLVVFGFVYSVLLLIEERWVAFVVFLFLIMSSVFFTHKMWRTHRKKFYEFEIGLLKMEKIRDKSPWRN